MRYVYNVHSSYFLSMQQGVCEQWVLVLFLLLVLLSLLLMMMLVLVVLLACCYRDIYFDVLVLTIGQHVAKTNVGRLNYNTTHCY